MKCIIIHGCPSNKEKAMNEETRTYDKHWIPWIKKQLQEKEIEVEAPLMPEPWEPEYSKWKEKFERYKVCLLYTSPSPRDLSTSRMPSSA